jgi:Flp pilus assembly pilin Flp
MNEPKEIKVNYLESLKGSIVKALGERKHQALEEFFAEESGQDQIEFALVAALLSLSAVVALKGLAADVLWLWQGLATNLSSSI